MNEDIENFKLIDIEEFRKLSTDEQNKYFKDNYGMELIEDMGDLLIALEKDIENVRKAFDDLK